MATALLHVMILTCMGMAFTHVDFDCSALLTRENVTKPSASALSQQRCLECCYQGRPAFCYQICSVICNRGCPVFNDQEIFSCCLQGCFLCCFQRPPSGCSHKTGRVWQAASCRCISTWLCTAKRIIFVDETPIVFVPTEVVTVTAAACGVLLLRSLAMEQMHMHYQTDVLLTKHLSFFIQLKVSLLLQPCVGWGWGGGGGRTAWSKCMSK